MLIKIWDYVRLLAAGCFFFAAILGVVILCSFIKGPIPTFVIVIGTLIVFVLLLWAVYRMFGGKEKPSYHEKCRQMAEALDQEGKLTAAEYKAKRAFQVEELEDEGLHFFIELEDGSVLFLSGQYLYDYASEYDRPRRFPCTEFTIKLFPDGLVAKIECAGEPLAPEAVFPPFTEEDWEKERFPEDLEILTGVSYDELKQNRGRYVSKV